MRFDGITIVVKVLIQRGLQIFPLDMPAKKCKEIFIVPKAGIEQRLIGYCNDYISKSVADSALVTFVQTLKLTNEQKEDLKDLLDKKYMVTSIKGIDLILTRIKENLSLDYSE